AWSHRPYHNTTSTKAIASTHSSFFILCIPFSKAQHDLLTFLPDPEAFTSNEAAFLRHQLHLLGPTEFARRTISEGIYTPRKLLTAFNIRAPSFLDEAYPSMLQSAIYRELHTRPKLAIHNSIDDAVELIRRSRNIVCLT